MSMRTRFPVCGLSLMTLSFTVACTGLADLPLGPDSNKGDESDSDGAGTGDLGGTGGLPLCEGDEQPGPRLLRLLTRREYQNTVRDLLGVPAPDVSSLPVEARVKGFDNNASSAAVTSRHIDEYLRLGELLAAEAVRDHKGNLVTCAPSVTCAEEFVKAFGLRAFRRPLSPDEVGRYAALLADEVTGANFDQGLRLSINAMLVSPSFLYRSEVGDPQPDGTFALSPYEVASTLSYLYWGSMPDALLFEAASAGRLRSEAELKAQAVRMLDDPRARVQLADFATQWLRTDGVGSNKDATLYPMFTDSVRKAMMEEQSRFFANIAFDSNGSFRDLFEADYVFANAELASFYGLNAQPNDFTKLPVGAETGRGGILGLGAVLASHAHSNESSPIKRGLFVRDRLLCQELPAPPANLDTTPPGLDPTLTTRERFAKHTSDPSCRSCHQFIDGVGFGLEGFDGIGMKRELENGLAVDTSGEILGLESLNTTTRDEFSGGKQLGSLLSESPSAQACLSLQYYRYARGYRETASDSCSVDRLEKQFQSKNLTIKELLIAITSLKSLTVRTAQEP